MRPSRTGIVEDIGQVSAELREKLRNCQSDAGFLSAFSFSDSDSHLPADLRPQDRVVASGTTLHEIILSTSVIAGETVMIQ